jgi:predicted ATPase
MTPEHRRLTQVTIGGEEECALKRAIEVARAQSAKLFELQAALSLAHLWIKKGKITQARDLVAPIFSSFGEGLNSVALREAKTLLRALSS